METKLTKKDLKSPDAFISNMQKFSDWAYQNRMLIIGSLSVVALAAVVWAALGTYHAQREESAQEALFTAEKKLKAADDSFKPTEIPPKPTADGEMPKNLKPEIKPAAAQRTENVEADYKEAIPALKDVIAKYGDTQTSAIAALDLARLYYDYKKYDDEVSVLDKASKTASHPVTKAMVLDNLGLAYEAKGDCNNAVTQWTKIADAKDMAPFHGDALIKSALCYEKLGQKDKAIAAYSKIDDAEKEMKKIQESLAAEYHVNPQAPPQLQDRKNVAKFQEALNNSARYQELESLLSDRQAVRAAKRYLKLIKKDQAS